MMKHADALKVAESLVKQFQPACVRIEIKGSICRLKPEPKDIEILAIPDLTPLPHPRPEFGKPIPKIYRTLLDKIIADLVESGVASLEKNGDRYKKLWLTQARIAVDLFLVLPPAQWGVQAVIRTGPSDFSHWMVTRKVKGGALPDQYIVQDGVVGERINTDKGGERNGEIPMPEEIDFLNFCGLGWIEPKYRVAKWGRK